MKFSAFRFMKKKKEKHHGKWGFFSNPHIKNTKRTLFHAFLWALGFYKDKKPLAEMPEDFSFPNPKIEIDHSLPQVTWVNHSTFLVSSNGVNILTDPIWRDRCSPVNFFGPKRKHDPSISICGLPEIHYIVISHNHYDHLDRDAVLNLHKRFPNITWMIPKKVSGWFLRRKITKIIELDWWEAHHEEVLPISFHYVPSQHFSGRGLFDKNRSLWGGWVVEFNQSDFSKKRVYFVGDTGYNEMDFKEIGNRFEEMHLSLIPIGTYSPNEFMKPVHICPEEAVNIHMAVGSKLSIGSHWKTFRLSSEPLEQPPYDLFCTLEKRKLHHQTFRVLEPGQTINW